ncbi:hypothetical protein OROMI_008473 [Orobanche minor]
MEDFFEEYEVEPFGTDDEYEFEASKFYDFTRQEFDYDIEEAERWFEVSGDYPHSPFIVKLNLEKLLSVEAVDNHPSEAKYSNSKSISSSNSDTDSRRHGVSSAKKDGNGKGKSYLKPEDHTAKVKLNSADNKLLQPRSTTTTTATTPSFMEPTASHLAKLKLNHNHNSSHICTRRFQKISAKLDQKGSSCVGLDSLATKRQKLDVGYLRKVAHLKHHFSLMHKSSKKEPELETMLRAQRRGSKNSCASSETEKCCNFKAHPLNKKILEPRLSPQPRRSPPPLPEFQVFQLKTTERATHHACAKVWYSYEYLRVFKKIVPIIKDF